MDRKSSEPDYTDIFQVLAQDELQSLFYSKDTLDLDYPHSIRELSEDDLWKMAHSQLIERLCDPEEISNYF
jgi:hypothetical protein